MNTQLTLLYVEDEVAVRKSYIRYLVDRYSFKIYEASNGLEALNLYKKHRPEIIISDLTMPLMDGFEFIEEVRNISYNTKVIIMTAHSEQEKMIQALDLLVVNYLIKPISRKKLCEVVEIAVKTLEQHVNHDIHYLYLTETAKWNYEINELYINDENIKLTRSESLLLELLTKNFNTKVNTSDIFLYIWDDPDKEYSAESVRTLVKKLRKKLPEGIIENVYGGYYKLNIQKEDCFIS